MLSMTAELIRKTPLRRGAKIDELINWVKHVAPCLVPGRRQSAEDTDEIMFHLMRNGFDLKTIAAALIGSGYKWDVRGELARAMVPIQMELDGALRRNSNAPQSNMGRPGPPNKSALKERAQYLDARFRANAHDPELQAKLLKEFVDLLHEADGGGGDLPPGGGSLERERERLRKTREEILLNSPNIARIVRNLGPLDHDRIQRLPPGPDGSTVQRTLNENVYRITPPRRAR